MHPLWIDLRGGFRSLWQNRLVSALAITSLALAIAGNTAVFSVVSAMFLRALPFEEPENLVLLSDRDPANAMGILIESKENFFDLRERSTSYENLIAFTFASLGLERDAEPEPVSVMLASPGFFETLRWQPALGRGPRPEEEAAGAPPVAVLSHSFWTARFAAEPTILGTELDLSGERYRVIGVLPESTEFLLPGLEIFTPARLGEPEALKRDTRTLSIFGRLADGVSLAEADREMRALSARLATEHPEANRGRELGVSPIRDRIVPPQNKSLMALLQGALVFVLLIASANVANLLLAQGQERARELAVRAALGAGRGRLFSQLLIESLALASLAFAAGLGLAWAAIRALRASLGAQLPPSFQPQFDFGVLVFTATLAGVAAVLFSLVPALRAARPELTSVLHESGRSGAMGAKRWLAKGLVVGQIALAVALLTGSVILVDAIEWLQFSSPGFDSKGILTATLQVPETRHETDDSVSAFYRRASQRIGEVAGVESASFVTSLPRSPFNVMRPYSIEGELEDPEAPPRTIWITTTPHHFASLGVPFLQGRDFSSADRADAPAVAIVNRSFARRHWPEGEAIGERVVLEGKARTIVGVVANVWQELMAGEGDGRGPIVYVPHEQGPLRTMTLAARVAPGAEEAVVPLIRAALWEVDPRLSIPNILTFEQYVGQFFGTQALGPMMSLFGGLSLLLAAVGIYGVIAFSVSRRTHEIGLRMALGASRAEVLRLIGREGVVLLLGGLALGAPAVLLVSKAVGTSMQQLGVPIDPLAALPMVGFLVVVALVACYLPARHAARLEPAVALRND